MTLRFIAAVLIAAAVLTLMGAVTLDLIDEPSTTTDLSNPTHGFLLVLGLLLALATGRVLRLVIGMK